MNVTEAATMLKVHPRTIYNMLERGDLKAVKKGVAWDISFEAIEKVQDDRNTQLAQSEQWDVAGELLQQLQLEQTEIASDALYGACVEYIQQYEKAITDFGNARRFMDLINLVAKLEKNVGYYNDASHLNLPVQWMKSRARNAERAAAESLQGNNEESQQDVKV